MRRILSSLSMIAAAAVMAVSCEVITESALDSVENVTLKFSSEKPAFADETKTEWTGETIRWSEGDKIAVAYTVDGNWQNANGDARLYESDALTEAKDIAQFNVSTSFTGTTEGTHVFYGVYPAPSETEFNDAPVAALSIPAIQTPKSNSFDPNGDLMVGVSGNYESRPESGETISLMWNRLVAHAVITLKNINGFTEGENLTGITLTAQEGANLVGNQNVNLVTYKVTNNDAKSNVLTIAPGNLNIDANGTVTFWACVLPETITELTVEVTTDKATYNRKITDISKTFKQNACNTLAVNMDEAVRVEEAFYEGEGKLQYFGEEGAFDTNHTYTWKCEGTTINIDMVIDLDQYRNPEYEGYSSWQLGSFTLPKGSVSEFLGTFVDQLDETSFYPVNTTSGGQFTMNSYKPGVWLDDKGDEGYLSCVSWQWYIWEGKTDINGNTISYDYSAEEYPGLFYVVAAPGSIDYCAGKKVVSTNYIVVDGKTYEFIVTFDLKGETVEAPKNESEAVTADKGEMNLTSLDMKTVLETSKLAWDCSKDGFNFEATISVAEASGKWGVGYVKFDYSVFNNIIGEDICRTTLANFYPVLPDGTKLEAWNSFTPGEWISLDGQAAIYGHSFWQLHAYAETQGQYYDIAVPGALIIGQCPGVPVAGDVAVSKAVIKDIPWTVTFKYVE